MSDQRKQESIEELQHQHRMIALLRQRRRVLEQQSAQQGFNASPHILTEIDTINNDIRSREQEIARLETVIAEDLLPLAEVEYRALLAEAWNTPQGHPDVASAARLELARLRLGIVPERAKELQRDVRAAIAEEVIHSIHMRELWDGRWRSNESTLAIMGRAIRFDPVQTVQSIIKCMPKESPPDVFTIEKVLFDVNNVWPDGDDYTLFKFFLEELKRELKQA